MYRHAGSDDIDTDDEDFDPLELDRFSYMQQLSRGLVESLNDITSIQDLLEGVSEEADVLLLQQSRINSDLQEGLMRTRLTPFSSILPRLRRIVRQTCTELNKDAQLVVNGADGEMDRTQLNRVIPALEHILRNAVGHGIESPEERENNGKSANGTIDLTFSREGSEVVLVVSDDGKGINIDAIRKKAIERGLLGIPDMQIAGNHSTRFQLNWTQDRIGGIMPTPWVVSLPQWIYHLLMLVWSLWLALSLVSWLRWAWGCFSTDHLWKPVKWRRNQAGQRC